LHKTTTHFVLCKAKRKKCEASAHFTDARISFKKISLCNIAERIYKFGIF
jgi:hypothetical protein